MVGYLALPLAHISRSGASPGGQAGDQVASHKADPARPRHWPPAHVQSRRGRLRAAAAGIWRTGPMTAGVASVHRVAAGFRLGPSEVSYPWGVVFAFTMRRAAHVAVIQPAGGAGLLVRCGSGRSDASGPGGLRLPRRAGCPFCWRGRTRPGIGWAVSANVGQSVPAWFHGRASCRSLITSGTSSSRSRRRWALVIRGC